MENNNEFKTTTLSGQMVISQTESGVDMIQGLPDNPVPEQVKPFSCWGHMHMLSNGMFDFISRIRKRNKPKFKKDYVSLSFCFDGLIVKACKCISRPKITLMLYLPPVNAVLSPRCSISDHSNMSNFFNRFVLSQ